MTTTTNRKSFYATTYITQGETEFKCSWDLTGEADNATAITHLTDLLQEAEDAFQETYEEGEEINLYGMTPKEFATLLVEDEEAAREMYGTTWEINTNFQEVDAEWEHPCNL